MFTAAASTVTVAMATLTRKNRSDCASYCCRLCHIRNQWIRNCLPTRFGCVDYKLQSCN